MKLHRCRERPDWKEKAEKQGFFYYPDYWDESRYYSFTYEQIESILEPTAKSLHDMCLDFVDRAVRDEEILKKLRIPEWFWGRIKDSWDKRSPGYMGRFDLIYDGTDTPKMMEYNADTPGMLYETGYFQLQWLEDAIAQGIVPPESDQFNLFQEETIAFFRKLQLNGKTLHFSCINDMDEDVINLHYLINCAKHVGHKTKTTYLEEINFDGDKSFTDTDGENIEYLVKYYPWEWMLAEEGGAIIPRTDITYIEPEWKFILSNKASLPYLWALNKGHPNLLPTYFSDDGSKPDLSSNYVVKPIFSREGANVTIYEDDKPVNATEGPYGLDGYITQKYQKLPQFDQRHPVIGAWIINDKPAGIAVREDAKLITSNMAHFAPHIVSDD